jgi:hypothetical protein
VADGSVADGSVAAGGRLTALTSKLASPPSVPAFTIVR